MEVATKLQSVGPKLATWFSVWSVSTLIIKVRILLHRDNTLVQQDFKINNEMVSDYDYLPTDGKVNKMIVIFCSRVFYRDFYLYLI